MRVFVCLMFLIISFGCFGQKEAAKFSPSMDSLLRYMRENNIQTLPGTAGVYYLPDSTPLSERRLVTVEDTIPVIMLCIDTSLHKSSFWEIKDGDLMSKPSGTSAGITFPTTSHPDLNETFYDYSVFWVRGYRVSAYSAMASIGDTVYSGQHYLNERKKKLNPCYIVWQSIEIK